MAFKSLNQLRGLRDILIRARSRRLQRKLGIKIGENCSLSLSSRFCTSRRGDIEIGSNTLIAFKTLLMTRDGRTGAVSPVRIGSNCFIGGGSMILPGVTIGDNCIIAGGAVVFEDVPSRCIAAGNPARVLRSEINVGPMGRLEGADANEELMYRW